MQTKITFSLAVLGEKKLIEAQREYTAEIKKSVKELEKLGTAGAKAAADQVRSLQKIREELAAVEKQAAKARQALGGGTNPTSRPTAPRNNSRAREYDQLIERANELRQANGRAADELKALRAAARQGAGRTDDDYRQLIERIAELNAAQQGVTAEIRNQTREFRAQSFAAGSYRELNQTLGRLRAEWRDMSEEARTGLAGQEHLRQIQRLDRNLRQLDGQLGITTRNVGNYNGAINRLAGILATVRGFEVFGVGVQEVVQANAEISDAIADVRKTTQLSRESLQGYEDVIISLQENLAKLDTRTSLADLLDISRIGGQLGVGKSLIDQFERLDALGDTEGAAAALAAGQAELQEFTESVNQLNVALGDELGGSVEDTASDIGKLNEILKVSSELGTGTGILAIGSAINTLGASGTANAGKIVDFTKRIGNIAPQANIAASDVLGLGAAMDEFGQAPELAATAVSKLLVSIGQDVPRFAKIAGISVGELSNQLKTDGNQAFLTVLEGAQNTGGGLESLAKLLEDFGITSQRATGVLGALTGNLDRVRELQGLAGEQFGIARGELEGTLSVTEEYNIKNQTLAAELDKLKNAFTNLVVGSGFQDFLASGIKGLVSFTRGLAEVPRFIAENKAAILALVVALVSFNINSIAAAAATLRLAVANKRKAISDGIATASQWLLNAALNANPIGIVVGLLALLVGAIIYVSNNTNEFTDKIKGAWQQVQQFYNSNLLVKAVLFQIIEPIKAIIFLVKNWTAIFAGAQAAAQQLVLNVKAYFLELEATAKIVGLQVKQAFTFDSEAQATIDKEIQALQDAQKRAQDAVEPLADVFATAYNEAQAQARKKALEQEKADQAKRMAQSQGLAEEKGTKDAEKEAVAYKSKFNKKEAARLKELKKNRIEAAKRIRALELAILEDDTARSVAQAQDKAGADVSAIVGDPEQVTRQAGLIQARLNGELDNIYNSAREKAIEKAAEQVQELGQTQGLLPDPETLEMQGQEIAASLSATTAALFDQQRQTLEDSAGLSIARLAGNPEQVEAQAQVIREKLAASLEALEADRAKFGEVEAENERVRQAALLEIRLKALQQLYDQEALAREQALAEKIEGLATAAGEEVEAQRLAQEAIAEAEKENKQLQLQAEIDFEKQRAELMQELALNTIDVQRDIAQKQIQLEKDKTDQLIQQAEKLKKQQQAALNANLGLLGTFVDGTKELLGEDEENRKKHGAALKALSLAEIAINLIREISAINAANSTYPEPLASFIKGAAIAGAIFRSVVATASVAKQEFKYGGALPSDKGPGSSTYVAADGKLRTREASTVVEGPAQLPDVDSARLGPASHSGLPGYAAPGSLYVVGQGYVPENGGEIIGPGHDQGGVKVVNQFGDLMELEGGEWLMKNGPESYIINRKSTAFFRKDLMRMRSGSAVYSPERRQLASRANSHNGWGLKFNKGGELLRPYAAGGVISDGASPATALGTTTVQPPAITGGAQRSDTALIDTLQQSNSLTIQNIAALDSKVEEMRRQMLTMRVINDPAEMVKEGLKQIADDGNAGGFGA